MQRLVFFLAAAFFYRAELDLEARVRHSELAQLQVALRGREQRFFGIYLLRGDRVALFDARGRVVSLFYFLFHREQT